MIWWYVEKTTNDKHENMEWHKWNAEKHEKDEPETDEPIKETYECMNAGKRKAH